MINMPKKAAPLASLPIRLRARRDGRHARDQGEDIEVKEAHGHKSVKLLLVFAPMKNINASVNE